MLTSADMAAMCGVATKTISQWQRKGLIRAHRFNDRNQFLYEHPGSNPPRRGMRTSATAA
jgi:DNA-binding transcriptional MerR regulator